MNHKNPELFAISPLDGRYASRTQELQEIVSEFGLIKYRVAAELEWLKTLSDGVLPDVRPFDQEMVEIVDQLKDGFGEDDALKVKEIEATTNHDVKAVEIWIREELTKAGGFDDYLELIHFGCTSEDINNLAYAMMLRDVRDQVMLPNIDSVGKDLENKAHDYSGMSLLAKTHGQPASPTTLGKEVAVFVDRLSKAATSLGSVAIYGKFSGATGTYAAHKIAYPEVDWAQICQEFVQNLGFEYVQATTQIEPHDWQARLLNEVTVINSILHDMSMDIWQYISDGVFVQKVVKGEVGSSTMPHKVNPIDFENAKANFLVSSGIARQLANDLPVSRLQRDLSDSSSQRVLGTVFGHSLVALKSLQKGLSKISPNPAKMSEVLDDNWVVLTEALQTVMRRYKVQGAYDIIKNASRGKTFDKLTYLSIISELDIPVEAKDELRALTPQDYIGEASAIAKRAEYSSGR